MTRATRTETQGAERRRRKSLDAMDDLKLAIPEEVRAKYPNHVFRWINDVGNRIYAKTVRDDWDKVEESLCPSIPVGTDKQGKPIMAHLCAKRREFHEEDQQSQISARRDRQAQLMRAPDGAEAAKEGVYALSNNNVTNTQGYSP